MSGRRRAAADVAASPDQDVRAGGILTDDGGRPVTDEGGRPVFSDAAGALVLDNLGTPPTGTPTATGTPNGPAS